MALNVTQGFLPEDFEQVDASTFLETWVNNTTVGNIPLSSFDAAAAFVSSQTDTPAIARGLLWFQRGAGRLWFFDDPDRGDSRYTATIPVSIAPTREILVQVAGPSQLGGVVGSRKETGTTLQQYYMDTNRRQTRIVGVDDTETLASRISSARYLTQQSTPSGYPCRAVEWGYCLGLMASGVSSTPGSYLKSRGNDSTNTGDFACHSRFTAWTSETSFSSFGFCLSSSGDTGLHVRYVYKRPTADYMW